MELPSWPDLALFTTAVLVIAAFVITVAGQFPSEHRKPGLSSPAGAAILWLAIAAVGVSGLAVIAFAWAKLPWYVAVISAGLMILIAPYILHPLPDWFLNGRTGIVVLAALAVALVSGMWSAL